ncbi:MAG: tRNA (adenosine(37)-N6)-dimethylallyltransferase MiaA [Spirochaetales bacterium]|jgi:tRNA dimethylallyltransferase|nr:tRNA (adenosine(37)-N6)-dimethylallyltransferase MiaA [Spirochaetales bacterium]
MPEKPYAVLLFGPTAVGKTALLEKFWGEAAPKTGLPPAEIINADSVQVYRGLDIGSAKPAKEFQREIPHHLIDILEPREQFTAGAFVKAAETLIREILGRGRLPLVSGGTAFYFRNLVYGLPPAPPADEKIRARLEEECSRLGLAAMYDRLQGVDPLSAGRISANDRYRVLRALEVRETAGKPLSALPVPGEMRPDMNFLIIGLAREREELRRRIDSRVDEMFRAGLAGEVKGLIRKGCKEGDPGMRGIGYREFFEALKDGCLRVKDIAEKIKTDSRRYAKRQLTFFKSLPNVRWLRPEAEKEIRELICEFLQKVSY